ncbi:MAG: hypothetical protein CNIPEHKO_02216 [Anaerolineales bacterium]|nr:hypothetical protein [Anaerolineales bacterium]
MIREEQPQSGFVRNEKWSNLVLVVLLLVRIFDHDLALWIFGANVPDWALYWYNGIAYILTTTIVWLNRYRLAALNIDRPFMVVLIFGGVLYALRETPNNIGALVGISAGLIYWGYINNQFVFKNPITYSKGTGLLMLLSILLALAPVLLFPSTLKTPLSFQIFSVTFIGSLQAYLALNVFEEVIFRGALWAYLRSLKLNDQAAFLVQAFLFWIAHRSLLLANHPYSFWVATPCIAILLGLLVWRTKSLTPSIISHFLFNFLSQILLLVF